MARWLKSLMAGFVLATFAAGCSQKEHRLRLVQRERPIAGLSAADRARVESQCGPFGVPQKNPDWSHGPTKIVYRDGYVLEHSSTDKVPLWVCEGVTPAQLSGSIARRNVFSPDPKLSAGARAELADYRGSGYDRGHQAPAGNQTTDRRLKDETFFLSNMAPQVGAFNQQIWAELEKRVRDWAERQEKTFIYTGGLIYDPNEENPDTADGVAEYYVIGPNEVAVPTHFYKIVVSKNTAGKWKAIAFFMENRGYPKPWNMADYVVPVSWIEQRTGLNFMPMLDTNTRGELEDVSGRLDDWD